ncbi:hypothetical protein TNCV_1500121 [Trichonephila clavipes]|nr:hypothetical protein TNCV_1500121 [Trichonephila clavipes]
MIKDWNKKATKCLITVDETWLYYYDPTIKQQNSEWKHLSSPTLKKAKTVKSAGKFMTIIFFFYYEGIVYQHAFEPGTTVNDSYYTNALRTMVQQVQHCFEMASYCTMTMPDHILLVAYCMFRTEQRRYFTTSSIQS